MTDYLCPECGHTPEDHNSPVIVGCCYPDGTKAGGVCPCRLSKDDVYEAIIASQAQALAEAREALNSVVKNIPSGEIEIAREVWGNTNTKIVLEAITKAAEWLKKYP